MTLNDPAFWKATAERVVSTFAASLLAVLTAGGADLLSVPWAGALSAAGLAAVVSLLKCLAATTLGNNGPSLTSYESVVREGRHRKPDPTPLRGV